VRYEFVQSQTKTQSTDKPTCKQDFGKCTRVRFEVFTAVTMKNAVFWDATPYGSCKNRRFGGKYRLYHLDDKTRRAKNSVSSN
jgi:hypothetical protein